MIRKVSNIWMNTIIQVLNLYTKGFVEYFKNSLVNEQIQITLISRICATSQNNEYQGLYDNGEVSPLVETEMIIQCREYCASYVAVRGAAPVFWSKNDK
jgi:SacI homology domain